jgi:hypothetical protein
MYFQVKNTLKYNIYHNLKHTLDPSPTLLVIAHDIVPAWPFNTLNLPLRLLEINT